MEMNIETYENLMVAFFQNATKQLEELKDRQEILDYYSDCYERIQSAIKLSPQNWNNSTEVRNRMARFSEIKSCKISSLEEEMIIGKMKEILGLQ